MWMVVYVSCDKAKADRLIGLLNDRDIMTMMRPAVDENGSCGAYEVLVPSTELSEAQDLIFDSELS